MVVNLLRLAGDHLLAQVRHRPEEEAHNIPPYEQEEPASPLPRQEALRPDGHLVALPADDPPVVPIYDNLEQVSGLVHI